MPRGLDAVLLHRIDDGRKTVRVTVAVQNIECDTLCSGGVKILAEVIDCARELAVHFNADKNDLLALARVCRGDLVTYTLHNSADFGRDRLYVAALEK